MTRRRTEKNLLFSSWQIFSTTYSKGSGPSEQMTRVNQDVKILDFSSKSKGSSNSFTVLILQLKMIRSYKTRKETMLYMQMLDEEIKKNDKMYTPSDGTSHFCNNLGTSPNRLLDMVSQPIPKMKKYHDFQSRKEEGNPKTILDFLSQGRSSKYS